MNRTKIVAGIILIGTAITLYSLGYYKLMGEVASGTVTIYPAAALAMVGGLTLWTEIRQLIAA